MTARTTPGTAPPTTPGTTTPTTPGIVLRDALDEDAAPVAALETLLFGADAWSEAAVREELTGPGRVAVVAVEAAGAAGAVDAVDAGPPVGYAVTMAAGDAVDLQRIAVRPDRQRHGVAARLLEAVARRAAEAGAGRMLLEVSERNDAARAFYARAGFTEIDRRRRYYRDDSDALVLEMRTR